MNQRVTRTVTGTLAQTVKSSSRVYDRSALTTRDLDETDLRVHVNLDSGLAGLCLVAVPFGGLVIDTARGTLVVPLTYPFILLLGLNLAFGMLGARSPRYPNLGRNTRLAFLLLSLLLVPVLASGLELTGLVAYSSFMLGTLGGILIGTVWRAGSRLGLVDLGAASFLVVTSIQLALKFRSASGVSDFHRVAVLDWGASNYIAGVMVVVSLALAARFKELGSRPLFLVVPALGIFSAILTLSRGAAVAAAAGLLVLFWNAGRSAFARGLFRAVGLGAALAAVPVFQFLVSARSQGGFDPEQNINARKVLFELAWRSFLESPISGTGWLALRHSDAFLVKISYAHNMVVSFLQIGGLFGAIFVVVLVLESIRAMRRKPLMGAAVVAALAISMSDPFFEGGVGAMVSWAAIMYASNHVASHEKNAEQERPPS